MYRQGDPVRHCFYVAGTRHRRGASRQAVGTLLNDLRAAGILSYTREYICMDDLSRLQTCLG